ncbi:MAG: hypothetical protein ABW185_09790 [Sedimenticola sp.]
MMLPSSITEKRMHYETELIEERRRERPTVNAGLNVSMHGSRVD